MDLPWWKHGDSIGEIGIWIDFLVIIHLLVGSFPLEINHAIGISPSFMEIPIDSIETSGFGTWILFSMSYMGCHPSHWRSHIFQDGYCTTNQNSWICPSKMILENPSIYWNFWLFSTMVIYPSIHFLMKNPLLISSSIYRWIVHEINHPAIGNSPWLWKYPYIFIDLILLKLVDLNFYSLKFRVKSPFPLNSGWVNWVNSQVVYTVDVAKR